MPYSISLLLCFFSSLIFAQESSLLWEVSGNDLEKPSYLYGTMHVADERVFRFGDSVMVKFNQCRVYAGELDMDKIGPFEALKLVMMPKDTSLNMLLSEEDYQFVKKRATEEMGSMAVVIDRIKPLFSSALISEKGAQKTGGTNNDSLELLDQYLQKLAKKRKMKVIGIETVQEQISAIDKMPLKDQAEILLSSLKEEPKADQFLEEMYELYQNQDLEGIHKLVVSSEMPDMFSESILTNRNYVMAGRISGLITKAPTFIGIGTAHLPGEEGVIELLRKKGYHVRPVISKYSGKEEKEYSAQQNSTKDTSGWIVYTSDQFQFLLPAKPIIDTIKNKNIMSVYTLEPNTDNLFSVVYYSKPENNMSAEYFFEEVLDGFAKDGIKVTRSQKEESQGFPSMEVEATQAKTYFRIKYWILEGKIIELTITADKNEVRSENSNLFFNSFKVIK